MLYLIPHFLQGFNPCFNGSSSATILFIYLFLFYLVSILVLMEVPLQPIILLIEIVIKKSFNPCFNGSSSATHFTSFLHLHISLFQSLF